MSATEQGLNNFALRRRQQALEQKLHNFADLAGRGRAAQAAADEIIAGHQLAHRQRPVAARKRVNPGWKGRLPTNTRTVKTVNVRAGGAYHRRRRKIAAGTRRRKGAR